jgi:hypothetical protein
MVLRKYRGALAVAAFVLSAIAAWYAGNWACYSLAVGDRVFPPLVPKAVNLIGVRLAGERITVSNGIAQIVQAEAGDFGGSQSYGDTGAVSGAKVPMKALVGSMAGDPAALKELAMALGRVEYEIEPDPDAIWAVQDIEAALDGDPAKRAKLESDLNTSLDGKRIDRLSRKRFFSGIFVSVPVDISVPAQGGAKTVRAHVPMRYSTKLASQVLAHPLVREKFDVPDQTFLSVYDEVFAKQEQSKSIEDVRAALASAISPSRGERLASPVSRLLERITVLVTEDQIRSADLVEQPTGDGTVYTVEVEVDDDGRLRLWQYTRRFPGCQLLLTVDGVAIAAPTVQHEMKYPTVAITNIADRDLATDAVRRIKEPRAASKS